MYPFDSNQVPRVGACLRGGVIRTCSVRIRQPAPSFPSHLPCCSSRCGRQRMDSNGQLPGWVGRADQNYRLLDLASQMHTTNAQHNHCEQRHTTNERVLEKAGIHTVGP